MAKILIVDDELELAQIFETALKSVGHVVKVASDGKMGISMAQQDSFDLIFLDQMMPDMSGNEVLKTLKADDATRNIKIAMLTNFSHDTMIKDALMAGAADYLLKYQISPEDIVAKTQSLLGQ